MFINSGLNKFFNYMPMPEDMPEEAVNLMGHFSAIAWLMPLIAVVEILGGILFMTNRYRALGAIILLPVMVGILLTHLIDLPSGLPIALVLFAILIWAMIENRKKYAPLFRS
jgi:uncharacterized membrane protein YphA (DoxX/SURF4 family)